MVLAETVEHACAIRMHSAWDMHCLLGTGRESLPPWPSSSSVPRSPRSDRSYLLPGDPTGDIAWKRPPKELLSSQMQTEGHVCEYLDWMQGFRSKTSRPSSQAGLQAPSTSFLEVRRVGCRLGVFFLFTLKALSGVRTVRGRVPTAPRRMPKAWRKPCGCLSERTHLCRTILQFSPWWWICWRSKSWVWVDSGDLLDQVMIAGDQRGTRENTDVALVSTVPTPALESICPFSPPQTPAYSL